MKANRISICCLILALLVPGAVSCSGDTGGSAAVTSAGTSAAAPETTTAHPIFDTMELADCKGSEFKFLVREDQVASICPEELNGDALNDAVYNRNREVENTFNVKVNAIPIAASWDDRETYIGRIRSAVMADEGAYDLVDGYAGVIGNAFADHIFVNLNDIRTLDLDSEWWSSLARERLSVNGRLYAISGDISTSVWYNLFIMYFNKKAASNLKLESPYKLVKDGSWTWDAFTGMLKNTYRDLNGDGVNGKEDFYGAVFYDSVAIDNFHNAFNIVYTTKDAKGNVTLDLMNERVVDLFNKLHGLLYEDRNVYYQNNGDKVMKAADVTAKFARDEALFIPGTLAYSENMRNMNADYGVIPVPKENEKQDRYYTTSRDGRSMFCIPSDVKDADFAGTITEALCVAGHNMIIPEYLNKTLQVKNTRDEESYEMIMLARSGMVLDFASEYAGQTSAAGNIIRFAIEGNANLNTYYESNRAKFDSAFAKFIEAYYN